MLILVVGGLCGLVIALARGGRLGGLAALRFRAPLLLFLAFLIQVGLGALAPQHRFLAVGCSYTLVGIWLVFNAREHEGSLRVALGIVAVGWLLNMLPIMLNGGMPVSADGLQRVGAPATTAVTEGHFYKHVPADRHTVLPVLGDVIPIRPLASVISLGDIVMFVGLMGVVASATSRKPAVSVADGREGCDSVAVKGDR